MDCPGCGAKVREEARACLECGEIVRAKVAPGAAMAVERVAGVPFWLAFDGERDESAPLPAGRVPRFFAYALDALLLSLVLIPGYLLATGQSVSADFTRGGDVELNLAAWVGAWLLHAAYFIVLPATALQGTVGKKLVGLKVVATSGERATLVQTALRAVAQAGFFGGMWIAVLAMFLASGTSMLMALIALLAPLTFPIGLAIIVGGGSSPWDWVAGTKVVE